MLLLPELLPADISNQPPLSSNEEFRRLQTPLLLQRYCPRASLLPGEEAAVQQGHLLRRRLKATQLLGVAAVRCLVRSDNCPETTSFPLTS